MLQVIILFKFQIWGEKCHFNFDSLSDSFSGEIQFASPSKMLHPRFQFSCFLLTADAPIPEPAKDPCYPSPCGPNANCRDGICTCIPEYQGDPYIGCRPECVLNDDCPKDQACIRQKCKNPCPGTCGVQAICDVVNHIPICSCPTGMSGNPFVQCSPQAGECLHSL